MVYGQEVAEELKQLADNWTTAELVVTVISADPLAPQVQPEPPPDQEVVPSRLYDLELQIENAQGEHQYAVWQEFELTLRAQPAETKTRESTTNYKRLAVPISTLELAVYVEAPGFAIAESGQQPYSIPLSHDNTIQSTGSLQLKLRPRVAGDGREIRVRVYSGKAAAGADSVRLDLALDVQRPQALPSRSELIDPRALPAPQPDVSLHVILLTGEAGREMLDFYLAAPRLGQKKTEWMGQMPYSQAEIEALREAIFQATTSLPATAPASTQDCLGTLGATLYKHIVPTALHNRIEEILAQSGSSNMPWTWLIVSDEKAMLPWELLLLPDGSFMADRFAVGHWVGGQDLALASEVPLARRGEQRAMTYYDSSERPERLLALPRWIEVLGIDHKAAGRGHEYLLRSNRPYFGLHFLHYYDDQVVRAIAAAQPVASADTSSPDSGNGAVSQIQYQQLDFTMRRPLVALSLVDEQSGRQAMGQPGGDLKLESLWLIPLARSGAKALVGPRWPTLPAADQLFYLHFYASLEDDSPLNVGQAVWNARQQVRTAFPERTDWLAYTYFGHPACTPYQVTQSEGFTFFEALDPPPDDLFVPGSTYHFRASYRLVAPIWYQGRLRLVEAALPGEEIAVRVVPAVGDAEPFRTLSRVPNSDDCEAVFALTMPEGVDTLPVIAQFMYGERELRMLPLYLELVRN